MERTKERLDKRGKNKTGLDRDWRGEGKEWIWQEKEGLARKEGKESIREGKLKRIGST